MDPLPVRNHYLRFRNKLRTEEDTITLPATAANNLPKPSKLLEDIPEAANLLHITFCYRVSTGFAAVQIISENPIYFHKPLIRVM